MNALLCVSCREPIKVMPDGSYYCRGCRLPISEVVPGNGNRPAEEVSSAHTLGLGVGDRTFQPVRAEDFIDEADEGDEEWVLEGRIPAGSVTLLVSPPKTGKSRFSRQLCVAMESGGELCGQKVMRGRSLYLALEERPGDVRRHLRTLGAKETLVLARPFRLTTENLARLTLWIREHSIKIVVVDTLNRAWLVESGSDRRQTDLALTPLLDIAHTMGCTVLILHHTRKAAAVDVGSDVAESNDIVAAADQVCYLRRVGNKHPNRRLLQAPGLGRYPPQPDIALEFDDAGIFLGLGDAEQVEKDEERAAILDSLEDWRTKADLCDSAGLSEPTVRRRLQELEKDNLIRKTGRGKSHDPYRYRKEVSSPPNPRGESGDTSFDDSLKPTDGRLVRYAVEQLGLKVIGRSTGGSPL